LSFAIAMHIRSPKDFWAGLIFVALGAAFVGLALQYRLGDLHRIGPGLFPTLVGSLLVGLGLIVAGRALVLAGAAIERVQARPLLVSLVAIVLFALALQWLGVVAAIAVLVLVGAYASRDVRLWQVLALAAFLIGFSVAIFVWLLGLPLPLWPSG
jgi:putative tricarboxylic transport membrane protein